MLIVGNGTSDSNRSNALRLDANDNLYLDNVFSKMLIVYDGLSFFKTSFTIYHARVYKVNNYLQLILHITNDNRVFVQDRIILGTLTNFKPLNNILIPVAASTEINNVLNRHANVVIASDGTIYLDNQNNADVREIYISTSYFSN